MSTFSRQNSDGGNIRGDTAGQSPRIIREVKSDQDSNQCVQVRTGYPGRPRRSQQDCYRLHIMLGELTEMRCLALRAYTSG